MIKLENVSTNDLSFKALNSSIKNYEKLRNVIISDCQQLSDLIDSGDERFNTSFFKSYLENVKKRIEIANNCGHEPELYKTNTYKLSGYDSETIDLLQKEDSKIMGNELLYANPFRDTSVIGNRLGDMSINYIKYLLSHCVVYEAVYSGRNALRKQRGFGEVAVKKIYMLVQMYEEQLIRQLKENNDVVCSNLFYNNYDKKFFMILDDLNNIVEYFLDNANECVWGILTDVQKKELLTSMLKYKDCPLNNSSIFKFINYIANYTTVSELEKGIVKTKTLDRFIVR